VDFFPQTGTGKWGWGQGFFPRQVSRNKDEVEFCSVPVPIPIPIPARGLNLVPVPVPIGRRGFFPHTGRGPNGDRNSPPHYHPYLHDIVVTPKHR